MPPAHSMAAALDYHEPDIIEILVYSSFLLVLNVANSLIDSLLSCGLVAQILVGVAWGTPGGKILSTEAETVITSLGYIGLILLVFEGGLSTSIVSLKKNLMLSIAIAITGIGFPIALSFMLVGLVQATPLQAFASGAALCSTSLGTTFTILKASGIAQTRLGSVLTSAAMLDDVVGLVMVQVISNLHGAFEVASVLRPVGTSLAFAFLTIAICWLAKISRAWVSDASFIRRLNDYEHYEFICQSLFLLGMVIAASFAGTSNLFAAYLAGVCTSYWYSLESVQSTTDEPETFNSEEQVELNGSARSVQSRTASPNIVKSQANRLYSNYFAPPVERVLKPFFFASIGFAIPITQMFAAEVVWRGIIYAILMCIAKLITGLWLVDLDLRLKSRVGHLWRQICSLFRARGISKKDNATGIELRTRPNDLTTSPKPQGLTANDSATFSEPQASTVSDSVQPAAEPPSSQAADSCTTSLYPACIIGTCMIARGEIGFLIAAVAQSSGVFTQTGSEDLYLVVIWAIVLCTIIGPVSAGLLARRVRRLQSQQKAQQDGDKFPSPLGEWGFD